MAVNAAKTVAKTIVPKVVAPKVVAPKMVNAAVSTAAGASAGPAASTGTAATTKAATATATVTTPKPSLAKQVVVAASTPIQIPAPAPTSAPAEVDDLPPDPYAEGQERTHTAQLLPATDDIFGATTSLNDTPTHAYNFMGISAGAFPEQVAKVLMAPIEVKDVEIKPDGMIYLPEIKYRRVLNTAFGPGGWALMPRSQHATQGDTLSREYALFAYGRFVAQARGEQQFFKGSSLATASEGCKSNALMRCCKDLGIASELWDPNFIIQWRKTNATHVWCENTRTKTKQRLWRRNDRTIEYPWTEQGKASS